MTSCCYAIPSDRYVTNLFGLNLTVIRRDQILIANLSAERLLRHQVVALHEQQTESFKKSHSKDKKIHM